MIIARVIVSDKRKRQGLNSHVSQGIVVATRLRSGEKLGNGLIAIVTVLSHSERILKIDQRLP